MSKPTLGLMGILAAALLIFAALSFLSEDGFSIGPWRLNTASFARELLSADSLGGTPPGDTLPAEDSPPGRRPWAQMDTTAKNILFIGDSMLEGLGPRLAAYCQENGHTLVCVIWYSSTTEVWGSCTRLKERIDEFRPDYIFVCLGANELFVQDIRRKRQRYLDNMLAQIGDIPYVWIGPPNWKPDTGINDMLRQSCSPGSFFLSDGQHFDRAKDGAHPTHASAAAWCDRVCKWVMTESAHPIKLETPQAGKARCRTIVYQPQR